LATHLVSADSGFSATLGGNLCPLAVESSTAAARNL
jgi:hypothetical protein